MKKWGLVAILGFVLAACNNETRVKTDVDSAERNFDPAEEKIVDSANLKMEQLRKKIKKRKELNDSTIGINHLKTNKN